MCGDSRGTAAHPPHPRLHPHQPGQSQVDKIFFSSESLMLQVLFLFLREHLILQFCAPKVVSPAVSTIESLINAFPSSMKVFFIVNFPTRSCKVLQNHFSALPIIFDYCSYR